MRSRPLFLALSLCAAPAVAAQQPETPPAPAATQGKTFSSEQLEQIVAPIALYPDKLLAQLFMASTYPIEIVEAARWVKKNASLKGDALEKALQEQTWDPAVKSLCGFPDVLQRMSENLNWTQDLGDAFLANQADVMAAVQTMRRKALDAGQLKSSDELKVTEESDKIIVIETAQPDVIYVPTYYPTAVYGSWSYPYWYYPPLYPPPPAGGAWFGFAAGVFWGAAIWGDCDWGHSEIDIDIDHHHDFVDRTENGERRQQVKDRASSRDRAGNQGKWQHDPAHRKGVSYRDGKTAQRFGGSPGATRVSRDQARGFADRGGARPATAQAGARAPGGARATTRPQTPARTTPTTTPRSTGQRSGSFSGSRSPGLDRAGSSRGAASRGSAGARGGGRRGGGRR